MPGKSAKTSAEVTQFLRGYLETTDTTFQDYCSSQGVVPATGTSWRNGISVPAGVGGLTPEEQDELKKRSRTSRNMGITNAARARRESRRRQPVAAPAASMPPLPGPDAMLADARPVAAPAGSVPLLPGPDAMLAGARPVAAPAGSVPLLPGPDAMLAGARPVAAPAASVPPPGYGQPGSSQAYRAQPAGTAGPTNPVVSRADLVARGGLMALNPRPPAGGQSSSGNNTREVPSSATPPPRHSNQQGAPKSARR
ncbi:hypothetical protein RKD31_000785 [Streptomyces sp. SAI-163]